MRNTTHALMTALTKYVANKIKTGQHSLVQQEAVRSAFREAMSERIAPMIKAAADLQRKEGLPHYLDCYAEHSAAEEAQDEGVFAAAKYVAAGVAKDGLGVDTKAIGRVVRALRKKKPKVVGSKVPTTSKTPKVKQHSVATTAPVKMTRQQLAKHLRASGNNLRKLTAKDLT